MCCFETAACNVIRIHYHWELILQEERQSTDCTVCIMLTSVILNQMISEGSAMLFLFY